MDPDRKLRLEREFQSIFRLTPPAFLFVADAIRGIVGRQPGARGPAPMKCELGLAIVLYYLSTGCSYKQVCHVMRSDMSQSHVMHCTRLYTRAINFALSKKIIRFPTSVGGMEHISGVFERRTSGIKRMVGAITNNSKCWCPATVLGPAKTAVTCSTVVGTNGTKEQHREDEMRLQLVKTGPAVPPV